MIHIEGLWAGYGGLDILRGLDLRVARGSINCVVGPNGAGKSTVLKGDQRSAAADAGGDRHRRRRPQRQAHPRPSCTPAWFRCRNANGLFAKLTVRQNVQLGAYIHRRRRKHVEQRYDRLAERFPLLRERPDTWPARCPAVSGAPWNSPAR